ncbi:MAG: dihydroorotate dehydrogenase [Dehalococcoidia bacterium]|nr:dihydroorotate dehydrogenase [Dehalococcoidia bacterium]MDW8120576.1 dihydroorotate dehydrogenase [Chloroflexota bacterium]
MDLTVDLAPRHPRGLRLKSPVLWASGTFGTDGYGGGLPRTVRLHHLGAVVVKTTTLHPRRGNPTPRIVHGHGWMLNSIGLENPGIDAVLERYPSQWATWPIPVIVSIAGERVEEFAQLARRAEGHKGIAGLELNLSCPNVEGGLAFAQSAEATALVVRRVKEVTSLPLIVKLSPQVDDIIPIARAAQQAGADALALTNTLVGLAIDLQGRRPALGGGTGGVSGPALKPVALAMVYQAYAAVDIPLIGIGGITCGEDALEYLMAGATAVGVGTAGLVDPTAPQRIAGELVTALRRYGFRTAQEAVGVAHRR